MTHALIINKYILSLDTIVAMVFSAIAVLFLPDCVDGGLCKDLLNTGISVLSIIFSIFFAALAFIISSSDDEFVLFLEEENLFTELVYSFKWTLWSLFLALMYSLVIYIIVLFKYSGNDRFCLHESAIWIFCFMFFYSLVATMLSTKDAILYAQKMSRYVIITKKLKEQEKEEDKKEI